MAALTLPTDLRTVPVGERDALFSQQIAQLDEQQRAGLMSRIIDTFTDTELRELPRTFRTYERKLTEAIEDMEED